MAHRLVYTICCIVQFPSYSDTILYTNKYYTLYNVHCTTYNIHCTVYSGQWTVETTYLYIDACILIIMLVNGIALHYVM